MGAGLARLLDVTRGTPRPWAGGLRAAGCLALLSLLLLLLTPEIGLRCAMAEDAAKPGAWSVAELAGTASARAASDIDGAWQPLRVGVALGPGSVVMTGADSRLVLFNGVDRIRMSADSQLEITAAPETGITRVIHWLGTAFSRSASVRPGSSKWTRRTWSRSSRGRNSQPRWARRVPPSK